MAYPRHQSGHLPVSEAAEDRWPVVSRHGYACALRAGSCQRAGSAGGQRSGSHALRRGTNTLRRLPFPTRFSPTTAGASRGLPMASSSRRRTIRPMMAASNTTRRTAVRRSRPSRTGSRAKANEFLEKRLRGVKRIPFEKALHASTTHRHDYLDAYIDRSRQCDRHGGSFAARRSAWGSIRSAAPASITGDRLPSATG